MQISGFTENTMSNYKNIIVAIDINAQYEPVINKALAICESPSDVSIAYIPLPTIYLQPYLYGMDYTAMDDSDRISRAREQLEDIAKKFDIPQSNVYLKTGNAADEIRQFASDTNADLIVIGTHGRSGFKLLLGSTANAVLHGVQQDVLAVRIHD